MIKSIEMDKESRKRIVKELDKNFFVEASAGSGKTTSLVYRMVALIERGGPKGEGVPVDKICTITFTKAAANEFFERFQKLLSKRSVLVPDDTDKHIGEKTIDTVRRCQEALKEIDSCFLGTIDAFCNMIAHELPSELGIPSDAEVVEKADYLELVRNKYLAILKDDSLPLHDDAVKFKELNGSKYLDALSIGVQAFLEMRHTTIIYDHKLKDVDFDVYLTSEKTWLLEVMKNLIDVGDCYNQTGKDAKRREAQVNVNRDYKTLTKKRWSECLVTLKYTFKHIKDMSGFNSDVFGTNVEDYLDTSNPTGKKKCFDFSEDFLKDLKSIEDKLNNYLYSVYCDFIDRFSDTMEKEFKEKGKFQYFDFLYYLCIAFKESANGDRELINHILKRHSYFLLDESQDTNPLQTEMFFYLTGTVKSDDWRKVKPKEGSLFIVGDPKQSIYSFRDANVTAYRDNEEIFKQEDEVLVLTRNYRSNVRLREWFNHMMNNLLNNGADPLTHLDIPVEQKEKDEEKMKAGTLDGVYKYVVDSDDEGDYIAQLILSFVNKREIYSKNEESKTPNKKDRLIRYSDFMIVPPKTDATKIVGALKKYHIPLTIEAKIPFEESESLVMIRDLTYLLKAPHEIGRFLRVAQSDLYKLTDKDIISMKNSGFELNIAHPVTIEDPDLDKVVQELSGLYNKTTSMGYSSTMLYLLNDKELNILNKISTEGLEYTFFLIQKVKEREENGSVSTLNQLEDFIANFLKGKDDQRSLRFKDKLNRVKLSNVHKVKGLQAPIVILAQPSLNIHPATKYVEFTNPPKTYYSEFSQLIDNKPNVYAETTDFASMQDTWDNSVKSEKARLEYVAATRAESVLIIGDVSKENNPWGHLFGEVDDNYCNAPLNIETLAPEEKTPLDVSLGDYNINKDSHNLTHKFISPSLMRTNKVNNNNDEIDDSKFKEKDEDESSTLLGTIAHRLMECLVSSKNKYSDEDVIAKISNEYGLSSKNRDLLKNILNIVRNGGYPQKNSGLDQDILKTLLSAKQVWCETPFSYLSQKNNVVSGVIDVFYQDQDDNYHIIDYKTNKKNDVSELEEHYKEQLDSYIFALRKMGIEADAHIYHIDLRR